MKKIARFLVSVKKEMKKVRWPGKKEMIEVEAVSPEAYVEENGRYPVLDMCKNSAGDTVITTGDGNGNVIRYTFTE